MLGRCNYQDLDGNGEVGGWRSGGGGGREGRICMDREDDEGKIRNMTLKFLTWVSVIL